MSVRLLITIKEYNVGSMKAFNKKRIIETFFLKKRKNFLVAVAWNALTAAHSSLWMYFAFPLDYVLESIVPILALYNSRQKQLFTKILHHIFLNEIKFRTLEEKTSIYTCIEILLMAYKRHILTLHCTGMNYLTSILID